MVNLSARRRRAKIFGVVCANNLNFSEIWMLPPAPGGSTGGEHFDQPGGVLGSISKLRFWGAPPRSGGEHEGEHLEHPGGVGGSKPPVSKGLLNTPTLNSFVEGF